MTALTPKLASVTAALGFSLFVVDCLDTRSEASRSDAGTKEPVDGGPDADDDGGEGAGTGPLAVSVTVDVSDEIAVVAPLHFGMHASVYDNALHHEDLPSLIEEAGLGLLRWPGGGYSDNYHWSNHSMTPWPADPNEEGSEPDTGYLAAGSDFGSFVGLIERVGTAVMITVNYGSNLQGTGPGEPKEAAAWVAYANGDPGDTREIGTDGAGNDWQTVGYWAGLRASEPEAEDDGRNFLRIGRPEPLGVQYWEIGNEVFGNGFHQRDGTRGFELDLHVPYPMSAEDDPQSPSFRRFGNSLLSGTTYGAGVRDYIDEMKAVDPSIRIGAVLGTPPADDSWMTEVDEYYWNDDVLLECGQVIDFVIVHWYPNPPAAPQGGDPTENELFRVAGLLSFPRTQMPVMMSRLRESVAEFGGDNAENVEVVMTEVGTGIRVPISRSGGLDRGQAMGMFAADMYLTAAERGFVNVDWLELHNGTFLAERTHEKGPAFSGIQMARLLAAPGDRLLAAESNVPSLVAHASVREDGRIGVLLINTQAPELRIANVTIELGGASIARSGERYDYFPRPNQVPDGGMPEAGAPDAGARLNAASGTVTGPMPLSDVESPFTLEVPPYGVTLLLFDPAE